MAELTSSEVLARSQWRKREYVFTTQSKQMCSYQHTIDLRVKKASQPITYYWIDDFQTVSLYINDKLVTLDENTGMGTYTCDTVENILDPQTIQVTFSYDGHVVFFNLTAYNSIGPSIEWRAKWHVVINYKIPIFNLKLHKVVAGCLETKSEGFVELQTGISRTKNLLQFNDDFIYYPQDNNNWSPYNIQYYNRNWDDDTELGDYNQVKNAWSQVKKLVFYTIGD